MVHHLKHEATNQNCGLKENIARKLYSAPTLKKHLGERCLNYLLDTVASFALRAIETAAPVITMQYIRHGSIT